MNELALFAGAGGGILASHLLGWKTVCAVEFAAYPASVLMQRQNDGILPPFPIWDDVCTFDGRPWRGIVDVVSGGFPCQDISSAGSGAGIEGERSGLWSEMARIIGEVRPRVVFVENSPLLVSRGLALVISDLAEMGYDCQWCIVSASDCGAPHKRDRIWIVANAAGERQPGQGQHVNSSDKAPDRERQASDAINERKRAEWPIEPCVGRVADGVAARMDRLKAIGNGQVSRVAATAFRILTHERKHLPNRCLN
jgi:DNA (cytosine-5)-methyltransferase 1